MLIADGKKKSKEDIKKKRTVKPRADSKVQESKPQRKFYNTESYDTDDENLPLWSMANTKSIEKRLVMQIQGLENQRTLMDNSESYNTVAR